MSVTAGRADLFTLWFGSNIMVLTIVTGALATTLFKLTLMPPPSWPSWSAIWWAVSSWRCTPHRGRSSACRKWCRAGASSAPCGAVYVVALVVVMYVGFVASNLVLGGQSLHSIAEGMGERPGIVLIAILERGRRHLRL